MKRARHQFLGSLVLLASALACADSVQQHGSSEGTGMRRVSDDAQSPTKPDGGAGPASDGVAPPADAATVGLLDGQVVDGPWVDGRPLDDGENGSDGSDGLDAGRPPVVGAPDMTSEISAASDAIEVLPGAELPEGLWVGELRAPPPGRTGVCGTESQRVTLQVRLGAGGEPPTGSVVFGDRQVSEPPTEPGYPRGYDAGVPDGFESEGCPGSMLMATYPYTLREGYISADGVFDFTLITAEPWDGWCSQQASHHYPRWDSYSCVLPMEEEVRQACQAQLIAEREGCPMSFAAFQLCREGGACLCFQDGCRANLSATRAFKLQRKGDELAGVITNGGPEEPPVEVRLRRVR